MEIRIMKNGFCLLLVVLAMSCKSSKRLTASGEANDKLSSRQLIKMHKKNLTEFKTLQAKVKIDMTQDG